ncbi:MAG: hypothetical protein S4CHLAM45_06570 [Chlamydiales bacterium]|nr:hypothetical protein [Chlamydiales bacterium]MCH9620320.1 hypothetical protein [Chlamydiales bacterium]MCH9622769.1 hypothetical protein [Chlamydiales bacterium]
MKDTILKCWFDGYNQRDWGSIQKIYSDNALVHGRDGLLRGGSSVVELAKKWVFAIPDAHITPLCSSIENDVIVIHWKVEGTFSNPIREIAATGKKITLHGLTCFRCHHEKIIEHWTSIDYKPLSPVSKL